MTCYAICMYVYYYYGYFSLDGCGSVTKKTFLRTTSKYWRINKQAGCSFLLVSTVDEVLTLQTYYTAL